jgi:hypothetical protein
MSRLGLKNLAAIEQFPERKRVYGLIPAARRGDIGVPRRNLNQRRAKFWQQSFINRTKGLIEACGRLNRSRR